MSQIRRLKSEHTPVKISTHLGVVVVVVVVVAVVVVQLVVVSSN
jgi:hypothetical protein